jgi:hypothetical protein
MIHFINIDQVVSVDDKDLDSPGNQDEIRENALEQFKELIERAQGKVGQIVLNIESEE